MALYVGIEHRTLHILTIIYLFTYLKFIIRGSEYTYAREFPVYVLMQQQQQHRNYEALREDESQVLSSMFLAFVHALNFNIFRSSALLAAYPFF